MLNIKKLFRSFGYAIAGMLIALREQQNMRIHLLAVLVVTVFGVFIDLDPVEWSIISLTYGLVLVAEMFNSAIEYLIDLISPQRQPLAAKAKDVAAGAVLVAAVVATCVAISIFGNKLFNQLL
ncbi:MAG: diacylglycerol kinase family protein [Chitinophagales bacterium]|nr:diacylglycerol kinase family protein [Chitinophagales bacterium]